MVCAGALLLAGCADEGSTVSVSSASPGKIGLSMPTTSSERWVSDAENMAKQFDLLGYQTDVQFAEDDVPAQVQQIRAMIEGGATALVVAAVDGTALTEVLNQAATKDIPVIAYDRLIRDTPNISYYASFDNFRVGVLQGSHLVEELKLNSAAGPFTIELFAGDAKDNNAGFFFEGAMSVLKPYLDSGKLEIPSGQDKFDEITTEHWNGEVAGERMADVLEADYQNEVLDAVLSPYDGISRGVAEVLQADGYGTKSKPLPVITGQDAELDSVKAIAAGTQSQTVYKDSRELAKVAVQMTDSVLAGGKPEINDTQQYNNGVKDVPSFLLQPVGVDADNYQSVLVDGGYYTASEIGN